MVTGLIITTNRIPDGSLTEMPGTLLVLSNNGQNLNQSKSYSLRTTAYLEIQPIKNLVFRSQFGYNMSASNYRSYTAISAWSNNARTSIDNVSQSGSMGHDWKLDNTLSYSFNLTDNQFDIIIGQTAEKWGMGQNISASGSNSIFPGYINPNTDISSVMNYAWVDNTKPTELSQRGAGGSVWGEGAIASFFGRINYNYKEKYMATVIFRADGSSNFARGKRWGYFPSASVGWTISNEDFMAGASDIIDFLKIRASWGQNGNCSIANFQYLSTIAFDVSNGYFASDKDPDRREVMQTFWLTRTYLGNIRTVERRVWMPVLPEAAWDWHLTGIRK